MKREEQKKLCKTWRSRLLEKLVYKHTPNNDDDDDDDEDCAFLKY